MDSMSNMTAVTTVVSSKIAMRKTATKTTATMTITTMETTKSKIITGHQNSNAFRKIQYLYSLPSYQVYKHNYNVKHDKNDINVNNGDNKNCNSIKVVSSTVTRLLQLQQDRQRKLKCYDCNNLYDHYNSKNTSHYSYRNKTDSMRIINLDFFGTCTTIIQSKKGLQRCWTTTQPAQIESRRSWVTYNAEDSQRRWR